jgi:hypothetical protein
MMSRRRGDEAIRDGGQQGRYGRPANKQRADGACVSVRTEGPRRADGVDERWADSARAARDSWASSRRTADKRWPRDLGLDVGVTLLTLTIELHAPTSSTQKLKLIEKGGQFTYTPTIPLTCRLPQAAYVEYWSGL